MVLQIALRPRAQKKAGLLVPGQALVTCRALAQGAAASSGSCSRRVSASSWWPDRSLDSSLPLPNVPAVLQLSDTLDSERSRPSSDFRRRPRQMGAAENWEIEVLAVTTP